MSGNGKNDKKHGPSGKARNEDVKVILAKHAGAQAKNTEKEKKFPNKGPKRKH
jgi:hypothetical protein